MNSIKRYTRTLFCSVSFLATAFVAGCGGGGEQGRDPILGLPAVTLVSVSVTPAAPSIAVGDTQQFAATATYSDGNSRDVTNTSNWTSASAAVATVNPATGLATGVKAGNSVISAAFSGKSGSSTLTVTQPVLMSLAIAPVDPTVKIGASLQLKVTATYLGGSTADVTAASGYLSAVPAFATVNASGLVTGVAAGSSLATASFNGKTASTTVTVPAIALMSIVVTPNPATIVAGATQQFVATGNYVGGSSGDVTKSVTWSSGNTVVAKVDPATGLATGVSAGNSNITATLGANSDFAVLTVTAPLANTVLLGRADSFAVLAGTALTNNSGGTTVVSGDVGSPSQTTDPVQSSGTNYKSGAILDGALADLDVAITDANSRTCTVSSAADIDLGGKALPPGVYCYTGKINITGTLTLNGAGVYIFRTASTLDTASGAIVQPLGGASADNVYWVPVMPTTLAANSVFVGSILSRNAAITLGDTTTLLNGRVLSGAAVTLRNNKITK